MEITPYLLTPENQLKSWEINFIEKYDPEYEYKYENIFVIDWEIYENFWNIYIFWEKKLDYMLFWKFNNSQYYILYLNNLTQVEKEWIKIWKYSDNEWKFYKVIWQVVIWENIFVVFYWMFLSSDYWNYPYFLMKKTDFLDQFSFVQ